MEMSSKPRYMLLAEKYPDTVIIQLIGGFYNTYGKSAIALSEVTGYKLKQTSKKTYKCGFDFNSLNKVLEILDAEKIGYVVSESGKETYKKILDDNETFRRITTDYVFLPRQENATDKHGKTCSCSDGGGKNDCEEKQRLTGNNPSVNFQCKILKTINDRLNRFCMEHEGVSRETCVNWILNEALLKYNY